MRNRKLQGDVLERFKKRLWQKIAESIEETIEEELSLRSRKVKEHSHKDKSVKKIQSVNDVDFAKGKLYGIDIQNITHISTYQNYISLHLSDEEQGERDSKDNLRLISLRKAMVWLSQQGFVRVNKQVAVNVEWATFDIACRMIILDGGKNFKVSDDCLKDVENAFRQ
jgi:DNA-binding LytR/AlgR family response regulator